MQRTCRRLLECAVVFVTVLASAGVADAQKKVTLVNDTGEKLTMLSVFAHQDEQMAERTVPPGAKVTMTVKDGGCLYNVTAYGDVNVYKRFAVDVCESPEVHVRKKDEVDPANAYQIEMNRMFDAMLVGASKGFKGYVESSQGNNRYASRFVIPDADKSYFIEENGRRVFVAEFMSTENREGALDQYQELLGMMKQMRFTCGPMGVEEKTAKGLPTAIFRPKSSDAYKGVTMVAGVTSNGPYYMVSVAIGGSK